MSIQRALEIDLDSKPPVKMTSAQIRAYQKMFDIIAYFFTRASEVPLRPFRGFLLEGPPASGKTEVAIQVAKALRSRLGSLTPPLVVTLRFIDSSIIAAPHWGEAEGNLAKVFSFGMEENGRYILLVDDIECLMLTRGSEIAKEWHYSINSVIFHRLDMLDPTRVIVIATTNRSDLIDEALRSRLYSLTVPLPRKDELHEIAYYMAKNLGLGEYAKEVANAVIRKLDTLESPTLRDIQHSIIEECVESGLWRARL